MELAARAVVAFFDTVFAATDDLRQDGCRYLLHELPKQPSVTVE